jgi:hypothetical protein
MKNLIKSILPVLAMSLLLCSCQDKETPVLRAHEAPAIGRIPSAIVIDKDNIYSGKLTVNFTHGSYQTPVAIATQLEIARKGTNFDVYKNVGGAVVEKNATEVEITYKELNAALTALGLEPRVPVETEVRIRTYASAYAQTSVGSTPLYSEVKTLEVTPFEPQPAWVYVVGEFQGWNRTGGYSLISLLDDGTYIGYVDFPRAASSFLILPDNSSSWDHKWGSDDGSNLVKDGGADIVSPAAGYHKITADLNALTIQMTPYSWGIIGDATPTGWDSDTDMTWNYESLKWEITIALTVGNFKLRWNNDWAVNYGITDGVATLGGADVPIAESGTYSITLDEEKPEITITKQ